MALLRLNGRWSLQLKLQWLFALLLLAIALLCWQFGSASLTLGLFLLLLVFALLAQWMLKQWQREVAALNLHAENLQDQAFNSRANRQCITELAPLADKLDAMSAELRQQRASLYQRELLLDTVLQSSPAGLVLTDQQDRVLLSNPASRQLCAGGQRLEGMLFATVLKQQPALATAIRQLVPQQPGALLHLGEPASVWHLSCTRFYLNQREHWLYLLKPMTAEIQREELNAWKKLLRVIGHELNNSLAPMSSLAYSGRQMAQQAGQTELAQLCQSLSLRCNELNQFLAGYLEFAKLPAPKLQQVHWPRLLNQLQDHYEFELVGQLPVLTWDLDQAQLTQLLLNLLKNAHEAGATATGTRLQIYETAQQLTLELQDDGCGLSANVLEHALVPFFTTKPQGSGIGLTLCHDIVQAHGGKIELLPQQRGLLVRIRFGVHQTSRQQVQTQR
jgi:nitrogen fixation/metabolism regulation signal transduction histidine kinase